MDNVFPCSYRYEQLVELPAHAELPHYYYPGASSLGGKDGITLRIRPNGGDPWLATFAFGQTDPQGVSTGVYTTPNSLKVCVVARGSGYFVNVNAPADWQFVDATPVTGVRQIASQQMLLFADFTRIFAYGPDGLIWKSSRLGWDGIKITDVTDRSIHGVTIDPTNGDQAVPFAVALNTGIREGNLKSA